ncbi:MAG: hypothetical protein LBI05_04505 [Planctomycetaceae bacterium]|nr:hypothetical protein [Planctomycetaceae bacterium]
MVFGGYGTSLFFLFILLTPPLFAEDLPVIWLEAGKEYQFRSIIPEAIPGHWTLLFEHRTLASVTVSDAAKNVGIEPTFKTPPLNPGITLKAQLILGDTVHYDVVIASRYPFEDRKEWFDKHPIALYDPEKTTRETFEEEEIPFQRLNSYADIESVEGAVIVVGQNTDFDTEKGLSKLLFQKAEKGASILVAAPAGEFFPYNPSLPMIVIQFSEKFGKKQGKIVFDKELRFFDSIESRWHFKSLIESLTLTKGDQP